MAHGCPLTRAALIQRGLEVVEVSITPIFSQKQQVEYALFSRLIFSLKVSDHALSGGHIRIHQAGRLRHVLECARAAHISLPPSLSSCFAENTLNLFHLFEMIQGSCCVNFIWVSLVHCSPQSAVIGLVCQQDDEVLLEIFAFLPREWV